MNQYKRGDLVIVRVRSRSLSGVGLTDYYRDVRENHNGDTGLVTGPYTAPNTWLVKFTETDTGIFHSSEMEKAPVSTPVRPALCL